MRIRALFITILAIIACGCNRERPAANAAVEVWGWNIAAASLEALVPAFQQRAPDLAITVTMSGTAMQSRFLLSLVAGVGAPDISQLQLVDAPKFTPSEKLADLTDVAKQYEHEFAPSFWKNCVHDDRVYAI
ncbi:MAG TPA: hypothetical protein ENN29_09675, partial [Candidatus Hydrogenedentes bacterium]|nr:hypothetical protein [Candidatus Hydrogenedentota bacterium]